MSERPTSVPAGFSQLLKEVKDRIQQAQTRAILAANAELVSLYWDIGRIIDKRQQQRGWGAAVIPRLSRELRNELPEVKGFSERNIKSMLAFYRAYPVPSAFVQQAAAQLLGNAVLPPPAANLEAAKAMKVFVQVREHLVTIRAHAESEVDGESCLGDYVEDVAAGGDFGGVSYERLREIGSGQYDLDQLREHADKKNNKVQQPAAQLPASILWSIPWYHHVVLMTKVKDLPSRRWHMEQTLANGWSRNVLLLMIKSEAHIRQGQTISNFERLLPPAQPDLVQQTLKDPYVFDFLTLATAAVQPSERSPLPAPKKRTAAKASKPAKKRQPKKGRKK